MTKVLLALTSAALLAMAGCASTETAATKPAAAAKPAEPAKPTISAEAAAELKAAQDEAKAAKASFSLWTTADAAVKAAEEAAAKGDSATVLKQAKLARAHIKLASEQNNYPMIKVGD
jgi:murein lipoprotein